MDPTAEERTSCQDHRARFELDAPVPFDTLDHRSGERRVGRRAREVGDPIAVLVEDRKERALAVELR